MMKRRGYCIIDACPWVAGHRSSCILSTVAVNPHSHLSDLTKSSRTSTRSAYGIGQVYFAGHFYCFPPPVLSRGETLPHVDITTTTNESLALLMPAERSRISRIATRLLARVSRFPTGTGLVTTAPRSAHSSLDDRRSLYLLQHYCWGVVSTTAPTGASVTMSMTDAVNTLQSVLVSGSTDLSRRRPGSNLPTSWLHYYYPTGPIERKPTACEND
ncbi:hypothetical protein EI94DRAFT_400207 [Lactarius quietus]|nr:hypothetical protein EI94DRAFT_400207 [Lactarius quietus]